MKPGMIRDDVRHLMLLAAVMFFLATAMAGAAPSILFIGNSFTMGDFGTASIPDIFYALSEAGGHTNVTVAMSAAGGTDYLYHSTNTDAQAIIASEPWTHVILQDYSTEPTHYVDGVHSIANFMTYGTDLYHEIMAVPGPHLVLLFETWSRSAANPLITGTNTSTSFSSTGEFQYELRTNYYNLADTLNTANPTNPLVAVAPVGDAWQNAGGMLPSSDSNFVDLYYNGASNPYYNGYHGNDNGYYLAAAVFYARIYGQSPEGLHTNTAVANLGLNLTVSPEFLESNAWATVLAQPQTPINIAENPASQTVVESNAVTFEALAEGSAPYYAQWFTNNVPIPGANSLSYHLDSAGTNLNGTEFTVEVSNNTSFATSQPATLTVVSADTAPQITNAVVQLPEDSPLGTEVYDVNDAQTGTDQTPNGTNLTYSITAGNSGGAFAIDPATGIITVINSAALNYDTQPSYYLTVSASDGVLTGTAQITVNLIRSYPTFLIDFGDSTTTTSFGPPPNDPSNYWNNITTTIGTTSNGQLDGLVTTSNVTTAVNLVMLSRFSGRNPDGTTSSSLYPANATIDSLFGNTEDYQGLSNMFPSFKLTGLETNVSYNLTFYASRLDATDNRETKYTVSGSSSAFVTLNPVSNVDNTVTLQGMSPSAGGEITVSITPGTNNDNAYHFTYLGVMGIKALPPSPVKIVENPASQAVIESQPVTFQVQVTGTMPYYAQWYSNNVPIPGANALSYYIDSASTNQSGEQLSVVVSNEISQATSQPATLTVVSSNSAPQITNAVVQLDEHSPVGTEVYDVNDARTGTDQEPDGTNLTYSITAGNSSGAFAIDAATGIITVSNSTVLDYNTQPSFYLTISASDGIVADTAQITVNLNKVDQAAKLGVAFLIDFGADATTTTNGAAPDNDPSNFWNNITTTIGTATNGQLGGLVTTSNLITPVNLVVLSPFSGADTFGTVGSSVYPANATKDSLFGNTEDFQGLSNVFPSFKLTGLETNVNYDLTFYASRLAATDNRETKYTISGSSSGFVTLNPVSNVDNTVTFHGMTPSAGGEITVSIAPGTNNNDAYHFTYLGVMRIDVARSNAVVTLGNLTQMYDGSAKAVSVTTDPANLPVSVTYDGSPDAPTNTGSYQVIATVTDTNYLGAATNTLYVTQAPALVTLTNLTQQYDGTGKSVLAETTPTNLAVALTYDGSTIPPTNAGSYQVVGTVVDPNYFGVVTNTLFITRAPALVTLVNLTQQYDGTGKSVLAETTPTNLAVALTYNGSAILPTNAGLYQVIATVTDPNYLGAATNTLHITRAPALVTLTNLIQQYDGTGKSVLVETTPTNLAVTLTYDGSAILPTNAGSYQVVCTVVDPNYFGAAIDTLEITQAPALVVLTNLTQQYDGTGKHVLAETTPTNLTVALTYDGSGVLPTNAGSYEVVGTVVDTNYFGAATNTLHITQAPALVILTNLNQQYDGTGKYVLAETTPTNLTVALTYDGSAVLPTNAGSYKVVGTVVNTNYFGSATNTLLISGAPLTITADNASRPYGQTNPVFTVSYSGFVNGEGTNVLSGAPELTSDATTNSPVGSYVITNSLGNLVATNYVVDLVNGTLSVTGAVLTATADNASRAYGQTNPVFTVSYSGFVNGEGTNVLSGAPELTSDATTNSPVGNYVITNSLGNLVATNYVVDLVNGTLSVTGAVLTATLNTGITANDKVYDGTKIATISLTNLTLTGVVNGDIISLSTNNYTATFATADAGTNIPVSVSGLTLTGIGASNYTLMQPVELAANITPKLLTIASPGVRPVITSIHWTNGIVTVAWNSVISNTYRLEYADNLGAGGWTDVKPDVTATNSMAVQTNVVGNATQRFYRIKLITSVFNANDKVYDGTTVATLAFSNAVLLGVVNADDVTLATNGYTANFATPNVGTDIPVTVSGLTLAGAKAADYTLAPIVGLTADITPVELTVTADNVSKTYGLPNPLLTASYSGFVNNEGSGVLTGAPVLSTSATLNSPPGTYDINVSVGTLSATNYVFNFVNGTLTVVPSPQLAGVSLAGNQLVLGWPTVLNETYQLEYKNSLDDSTWTPLGGYVTGTGNSVLVTNLMSGLPQRFFRLSISPAP